MSPEVLGSLREAGRIAGAARERGLGRIVAGASLREVCESIEDDIRSLGGAVAFPVQSSRNQVAAHYCASPEDDTVYADGDLAKLDVGVHVDGYVVDTAATVNVGARAENGKLVEAARAAVEAALRVAGPGVPVTRLSAMIDVTIRSHGLRPMRNLCGHGVGRWTVHCPPPIPNIPDESETRLSVDQVVAIEPFATDGQGFVVERGKAEVFRLDPRRDPGPDGDAEVVAAMRAFRGLPFARRQLGGLPRPRVEATIEALARRGTLVCYAPLVESGGRRVAQAEHTLLVGPEGIEVLTR